MTAPKKPIPARDGRPLQEWTTAEILERLGVLLKRLDKATARLDRASAVAK
jgi:hypothetical protein